MDDIYKTITKPSKETLFKDKNSKFYGYAFPIQTEADIKKHLESKGVKPFLIVLIALGITGVGVLALVTQIILDLPRWFEPQYVIPLAGMVFANSMNTISLVGERFNAEQKRGESYIQSRNIAMGAAMIPQVNALLAVGLVALPGMMTGQILSGIDPLTAARYQIMVMCMIFSTAGLSAVLYLFLHKTPE